MQVLFMCTANSCRSVLSEGLFNHLAPKGFGELPEWATQSTRNQHLATPRRGHFYALQHSKGSESLADNPPDIVITVCDKAGGEPCPVFFGSAIKCHWGLADPSEVEGSDEEIQAAFDATVAKIRQRFAAFFFARYQLAEPD